MNIQSVRHSFFLVLSTLLIWLWSLSPTLNIFSLQLTGALTLLYFVFKKFLRLTDHRTSDLISTAILNSVCLLLIFSTGGVSSPLFFLLDFLLIAIALMFESSQAIVLSVILAILFSWQNQTGMTTERVVNIISLLFMAPIAMIFSRNYLETLQAKGTIKILENDLQKTETDSLLWISTKAKPSLVRVLDAINATTDLIIYFNSKSPAFPLPPSLNDKLKDIQQDIIALYSSANTLESSIEETSNKVDL